MFSTRTSSVLSKSVRALATKHVNYAQLPPQPYKATSTLFQEKAPSYEQVVAARNKYLAPSLRTFQAFDEPLVLKDAWMQYIWDIQGRKYVDLLGQNLCISVGHRHPAVTAAAVDQVVPPVVFIFISGCCCSCAERYNARCRCRRSGCAARSFYFYSVVVARVLNARTRAKRR